jgi:hypothetical protein
MRRFVAACYRVYNRVVSEASGKLGRFRAHKASFEISWGNPILFFVKSRQGQNIPCNFRDPPNWMLSGCHRRDQKWFLGDHMSLDCGYVVILVMYDGDLISIGGEEDAVNGFVRFQSWNQSTVEWTKLLFFCVVFVVASAFQCLKGSFSCPNGF